MSLGLNDWKQKIIAFAGGLGAPGLLLISFLDSSVLSFPIINDLLLIQLSMQNHARMPLYALMAALGSVLGCVVLYFLARMGGEAYFHRKAGERAHAIRHWVERNGFGGMLIAALLPPPTPDFTALMIELTGRDRTFIIPMIVAAAVATLVARTIDPRSIYDARLTDAELEERQRQRERPTN